MHLPNSLLFLLFASTIPPNFVVARVSNVHYSLKRSSGLANDLRVALRPIFKVKRAVGAQGVACTSRKPTPATVGGTNAAPRPPPADSPWTLVDRHEGDDFFTGWTFYTAGDPTHGVSDYIDQATAVDGGLIEINDRGHAIMRVDTSSSVQGQRKAVRIHSRKNYNGGLFVFDAVHMPTGCGTWPAFWSHGPAWPSNGEIDIIEGVHQSIYNQVSVHTASGCRINSSDSADLHITGDVLSTNCAVGETRNSGCGIRATQSSFGPAFNSMGGGVYAMQWDDAGIVVWFFPRTKIPVDIEAEAPITTSWGRPMARIPAEQCSPARFYRNHNVIVNTALCGDMANAFWSQCATKTQAESCPEFVLNNGDQLDEAYWQIRYLHIYQPKDG